MDMAKNLKISKNIRIYETDLKEAMHVLHEHLLLRPLEIFTPWNAKLIPLG